MQKKSYETPALEEAGSFEDVTLAIAGGTIADADFPAVILPGDPIPTGVFS
ncbi:lasso RiPP family leader peptide-containing protein [Hyphococcus sp.]|uniref:lasso RiPP family leader peptide-containing protein n=1 Tax=Hyphococcus sp. TaxID=2038636 RepID=UPI0035C67D32